MRLRPAIAALAAAAALAAPAAASAQGQQPPDAAPPLETAPPSGGGQPPAMQQSRSRPASKLPSTGSDAGLLGLAGLGMLLTGFGLRLRTQGA